jgi:NADH-quinone oxidoreductase subunit A
MGSDYIAVTLVVLVGAGVALQFLALAKFLGERRPSAAKDITYEAGSDPVGDPRARFPVRFYPLAILFVVFDIEAAFFYPWAVIFASFPARALCMRACARPACPSLVSARP